MATDTVLNELILQEVTQAEYEQLEKDNLLDENRVYLTPDNSLKGTLLDFKWADHILNDMSWLRADTFSWHDGEMYKAAYNHLVADFEGTVAETTTIDGIEITYYLADDKHIICLPDQEDKVLELYNKTGVAWYYILDTANKQFKLPRTKYGFTGLRDKVGGYVPESLPNIRATSSGNNVFKGAGGSFTGAFVMRDGGNEGVYGSGGGTYFGVDFDASLSSPTYQDNAPVQERATQMYLYFYVGNFERDAVEQTAGIVAEMFNNKADSDLGNIPTNYDYVVESQMPTAENGYTWYRKYKSGWVEQGGSLLGTGGYVTTVFPVEFTNDKYTLVCINHQNSTVAWSNRFGFNKTATGFTWVADSGIPEDWQASGMSAQ